MKLSIAYAAGPDSFWQEMELTPPITAQQAIEQSKLLRIFPTLKLDQLKIGVFGQICLKTRQLEEGDRVEIYQPVTAITKDVDDDED